MASVLGGVTAAVMVPTVLTTAVTMSVAAVTTSTVTTSVAAVTTDVAAVMSVAAVTMPTAVAMPTADVPMSTAAVTGVTVPTFSSRTCSSSTTSVDEMLSSTSPLTPSLFLLGESRFYINK